MDLASLRSGHALVFGQTLLLPGRNAHWPFVNRARKESAFHRTQCSKEPTGRSGGIAPFLFRPQLSRNMYPVEDAVASSHFTRLGDGEEHPRLVGGDQRRCKTPKRTRTRRRGKVMNGLECLPARRRRSRRGSRVVGGMGQHRKGYKLMSEDLVSPEIAKALETPPPSFSIGHGINDWLPGHQPVNF